MLDLKILFADRSMIESVDPLGSDINVKRRESLFEVLAVTLSRGTLPSKVLWEHYVADELKTFEVLPRRSRACAYTTRAPLLNVARLFRPSTAPIKKLVVARVPHLIHFIY